MAGGVLVLLAALVIMFRRSTISEGLRNVVMVLLVSLMLIARLPSSECWVLPRTASSSVARFPSFRTTGSGSLVLARLSSAPDEERSDGEIAVNDLMTMDVVVFSEIGSLGRRKAPTGRRPGGRAHHAPVRLDAGTGL